MNDIREIPDFPGYGATPDGAIWSKWGMGTSGMGSAWKRKLRPSFAGQYLKVGLRCPDGSSATAYIHQLVWAAFYGWPSVGKEINHINGRKTDNAILNLEAIDHRENVRHSFRTGLHPRGEARPFSKLTKETARAAKVMLGQGMIPYRIASMLGVNPATIGHIKSGKTWAWVQVEGEP